MYRSVPGQVDLPALDHAVLELWRDGHVFARSLELSEGRPEWVFYEGPPTANGMPGAHHIEARVFKDVFPRYKTMKGFHVARKAGWDCHGLPVELAVEKELGFTGKPDIEAYGVAEFNQKCRESVGRHTDAFAELTERMGYWVDLSDAYWTMDASYIESVWWSLKRVFDAGLLVEDFRVAPWCPRDQTGLSDHEVAQGYENTVDPSVYVRFPLTSGPLAGTASLLVWTTTPWTLVSNVAVAVHPDVTYVLATDGSEQLIVAEALAGAALGDGWTSTGRDVLRQGDGALELSAPVRARPGPGRELRRARRVRHRLRRLRPGASGAGFRRGRPGHQPGVRAADGQPGPGGRHLRAGPAAGRRAVLQERRRSAAHRPDGARAAVPLPALRAQLSALLAVSHPADLLRPALLVRADHVGPGRDAARESARQLAAGNHQERPVRRLADQQRRLGAVAEPLLGHPAADLALRGGPPDLRRLLSELGERAGADLSALDPHRPYIDDVTFACHCGATASRVPEVIDAWYDSGAMPFAQYGYPYRNVDLFEKRFPAQFISEAIDQTRGWFYTLMAIGTLVFDRAPYENVVCLGHILAEDGRKMSKHLGNILQPIPLMDQHGADAVRWFMAAVGSPWAARRIGHDTLQEVVRKTLLTYWNIAAFQSLYGRTARWSPSESDPAPADRPDLDRWVLSELNALVRDVDAAMDAFDTHEAGKLLSAFVDDLSNWYVRRSRRRFWQGDPAALATLHQALTTVTC